MYVCGCARARYRRRCREYLYLLIAPWKLAGAACVASVDRRGLQADVIRSASAGYWFSLASPRQARRDWSINRESGQTRPWTTTGCRSTRAPHRPSGARAHFVARKCIDVYIFHIYVWEYTCGRECACARAPRWYQFATLWCYTGGAIPPEGSVGRKSQVLRGRDKSCSKRAEGTRGLTRLTRDRVDPRSGDEPFSWQPINRCVPSTTHRPALIGESHNFRARAHEEGGWPPKNSFISRNEISRENAARWLTWGRGWNSWAKWCRRTGMPSSLM